MTRRPVIVFVLVAALAGCSSGASTAKEPSATTTKPAVATTTTTTPAREQVVPTKTRFTVDGQAVDLICRGHGDIPIVFLAGGRELAIVWNGLIDSLGDDVFTCVFNRPGTTAEELERHQPPTELTTPRAVANSLAETLEQANIGPRVILVGHSAGGASSLVFGADHPERVAGAVLFDPSVPPLVPLGEWERIGFRSADTAREVGGVTSWPDVPLVVLSGDAELVVKNHEATAAEEREWIAAHQRWAHLSSKGSQREVPGTNHFVYLTAPKVATATLQEVLRAAEQ